MSLDLTDITDTETIVKRYEEFLRLKLQEYENVLVHTNHYLKTLQNGLERLEQSQGVAVRRERYFRKRNKPQRADPYLEYLAQTDNALADWRQKIQLATRDKCLYEDKIRDCKMSLGYTQGCL